MAECNIGLGLRTDHYSDVLNSPPKSIKWFEVITENFFESPGRPLHILEKVRQNFPVALHGVSLALGSTEPLHPQYLKNWRALIDRIDPIVVSDHLCWTGHVHGNIHDLLPLPLTNESLQHLVSRIEQAQNYIGRQLLIENVSSYLTYKESTWSEWEFLVELCERAGCQLLLDVNNVFVSAKNHNFNAFDFLNAIPEKHIGQVHLAGHTDMGTHLFDTHSAPVADGVWELYQSLTPKLKQALIMIEWDDQIPPFAELVAEAMKAKEIFEYATR